MAIFTRRPALRWLVPAGVALAVVGGGAMVRAVAASADPVLPPRSAAQLLVDLQTAKVDGLSGTVIQRADLGLPSLPGLGGQGSISLTSLLSGSHTLRVWYSGPDKARVALHGTLGETDVIADGNNLWIWDSQRKTASHQVMSGSTRQGTVPDGKQSALPRSPQEAADLALHAIDPSTAVTTAGSARVAGRAAYELVLAPRDAGSLVGQVRIAIDATKHVPLRAQVYPRGSDATAFEVAFTQVNFTRPDDAQFRFNPPPGTTVEESLPQSSRPADAAGQAAKPVVIGTGWTSVLAARIPADALTGGAGTKGQGGSGQQAAQLTAILDRLPSTSGPWGSGKVLSGRLFSVLLTDDGRLFAGAVATQRLTEAAADPAAALQAPR